MFNDGRWFKTNAKFAAANELARHPELQKDDESMNKVCEQYGFSLNEMSMDECSEFKAILKNSNERWQEFLNFLDTI